MYVASFPVLCHRPVYDGLQYTRTEEKGLGMRLGSHVKMLLFQWLHFVPFQNLDLGVRTDGVRVNDVVMPPWAKGMLKYIIVKCIPLVC